MSGSKHSRDAKLHEYADISMSDIEIERLERLKANRQRMAELDLPALAASIPQKSARAPKSTKLPKRPSAAPVRHSARVRGEAADPTLAAGISWEWAGGAVELSAGSVALSALQSKTERHPKGTLPFSSLENKPLSDASFLKLLRSSQKSVVTDCESSPLQTSRLSSLSLKEEDVLKITRDGITCMAFHPAMMVPFLAAGDKQGNLSLWNVDSNEALSFSVHSQYISSLHWLEGHTLATASYDGSIRMLDVNRGDWEEVHGMSSDIEISAMDCRHDGSMLYVGDNTGQLLSLDSRQGKALVNAIESAHDKRINTVHLECGEGVLVATSSSDASVKVWDTRRWGVPLHSLPQNKSCHTAYWSPDKSKRLLTTSYDDTIRVWGSSGNKMELKVNIHHDNQTGRWITPFRSIWGPPGAEFIAVGSMKRGVDLFSSTTGSKLGVLQSELMTAIPSRCCVHSGLGLLAAATSSGRVHVWR